MGQQLFTVESVTPHMGAEISGIDLREPIGTELAAGLRDALHEHLVLFFRDQPISHRQHSDFARIFGEPHIAKAAAAWSVAGFPEVVQIHADADSKFVAGEDWHSDMTCDEAPPLGSALYLHTVPKSGGDTAFSNMFAAYDALSDTLKTALDGLTATHDARLVFGDKAPPGTELPINSHPVIRTHPESGRKAIFVNRHFTVKIDDLPAAESEALLGFLYEHVQRPQFQCRFRWQPHSIALWDNRSVQHSAIWDYFPQTRSGFRVQIAGTRPF
ncbi:TauD/TfdA dioxygenase family protein [Altericroceibacterium endophyticum]|uniref:Taurine dioxygenase n=1 Tax=Altericroceibacterium endophyticum TaxID=1808508 RepID=A0A6I4T284_9SPHN|nr:TauD/TfdA family dioxygenase [Altericroceibacterium endophyticum]MXO65027.1 taurine dioxygenase [Altericroceibacterium endophyticum]